jgi:hypothetical protein
MAVDLITSRHLKRDETPRCYGVYALDMDAGRVETLPAAAVVLATGGVGKVYRYTSNPDTATGDGIAMAWRAGCRVANMEFIQFHPTCLYHPQERSFLITEAMRGEGAYLTLPNTGAPGGVGTRFMPDHDPRGELAPRDIVARAIDFEMKKHGLDHVWLDARHLGEAFLKEHFPTIHARCLALGIDIARQPIPVVPAAHYTCGGVVTDLEGRTDSPGLYAVGETTYTGLHGANRLASNSLLECVVLGRTCAQRILESEVAAEPALPPWDESQVEDADEQVVIAHNWDELRLLMWNYVGIVRTTQAARTRTAPHQAAEGRDRGLLRQLPRHARPAGTAQPGGLRAADRRLGAAPPRKPRAALQPRLPAHAAGELPDRADAAREERAPLGFSRARASRGAPARTRRRTPPLLHLALAVLALALRQVEREVHLVPDVARLQPVQRHAGHVGDQLVVAGDAGKARRHADHGFVDGAFVVVADRGEVDAHARAPGFCCDRVIGHRGAPLEGPATGVRARASRSRPPCTSLVSRPIEMRSTPVAAISRTWSAARRPTPRAGRARGSAPPPRACAPGRSCRAARWWHRAASASCSCARVSTSIWMSTPAFSAARVAPAPASCRRRRRCGSP